MEFIIPGRRWTKALFVGLAVVSFTALSMRAFGQVETGQIAGTVRDPSGAVIAGANVTATSLATSVTRSAETNKQGEYVIPSLSPGNYTVKVASPNFASYQQVVEVRVGGKLTLDAQLEVGKSSTVIEVTAGAAEVNTQSQELSQLVDTQQLMQLPSLTRNPYDFVAISGNVSSGDNTTTDANSGQELATRGVGYAINGQRESGTEILLDGVENVSVFSVAIGNNVPIDSVQEYSVITNNFSPEYGRASGGVVNVSSKTGTNALHGGAWEYNRLSAYTANTYANDAANAFFLEGGGTGALPAPKGEYTRNQFGFQIGGPIIKDKLFFYEATEWTRVRSQATESEEILDPSFVSMLPANAQAYFATYGTGAFPASGRVTTAGQLAAVGYPIGPINGVTTVPASTPVFDIVNFKANFDAGGGLPQNGYTLLGRIDFNVSNNTQMFFRAGRESYDQFLGTAFYSAYPQYDAGYTATNQSYLYSLNHTFNPNVLTNSKISFTRFNDANSFNTAFTNVPNLMIVPPTDPVTLLSLQLPGAMNYGEPGTGGLPYGGPQNTFQFQQDLAWTKGRHALHFGGQYTYIQLNVSYGAYVQALEQLGGTFGDSLNDLTNIAGNPGGSQLVTFASRLSPQGKLPCVANPGYWLTYSPDDLISTPDCEVNPPLGRPSYARSYRYKDWAFYANDSFRVTPRLTINYGLRYEHYGVQHNGDSSLDSNFYFGSGSTIEEQVRAGEVFIANKSPVGQFWAPRWGTAAPRVGFAYDMFGDGKSSLRGGFGISYERNFGNVTYNASFNPPASAVPNSLCAPAVATCPVLVSNNGLGPLGSPGPPTPMAPVELRMPNPNINVAQTQFWSLALQRELTRNTILEVGYSGAHGVHLYDIENINQLGAGQFYLGDPLSFPQSPDCPSPCLDRANNQYANINMRGSLGSSSYNALNVKVQTRNLHNSGVSLVANYTYSHSLDDLSSTFSDSLQGGSGVIGSLGYTDPFNPKLDWGSSDYDLRNRFVVSPIWETPWYKNTNGFAGHALGGWSLSGIITARSGIPFSIYDYTNDINYYTIPRLTPATPITSFKVSSPHPVGPNLFNVLSVPVPASFAPLDPTLGMSDFGPFPANMTHRNAFRAPGAWNADLGVGKNFKITERVGLQFRAEGFDVFNHHNYYVNTTTLYYDGATTTPMQVTALKGGLGTLATGGNHDERRFGQFSLKLNF